MVWRLNTQEESRKQLDAMIKAERLPDQDEIFILDDGTILVDETNPISNERLGTEIGPNPILCG